MKPLVMLPGQSGEVTGVAWCPSQLSKVRKMALYRIYNLYKIIAVNVPHIVQNSRGIKLW